METQAKTVTTTTFEKEAIELLGKASELIKLLKTASDLGYSITFSPE